MKRRVSDGTGRDRPFLHAEECGLTLLQSRRSGAKLCMDKELWSELVSSVRAGLQPR